MSYFGNQGPAQDGGFISGIARGNARLHNAKVTRARYQKGLGFSPTKYLPGGTRIDHDDQALFESAKKFSTSYQTGQDNMQAVEDGLITPQAAKVVLDQYEADRQQIANWAESGPYVKESKAFMVGTAPLLLAIGGFAFYTWLYNRPIKGAKGTKSAFYGVFA